MIALDEAVASAERPGLAVVCARRFGVIFALSAALNLILPELGRLSAFTPALAGLALVTAGFWLVPHRGTTSWLALVYTAGLATLATFLLPGSGVDDPSTLATVTAVSSFAIPSVLVAVAGRRGATIRAIVCVAVVAAMPVAVLAALATAPEGRAPFVVLAVISGWAALTGAGIWLTLSEKRANTGVQRLRQGFAAERRFTEAEAELRYGARMMHDTVLATLTLVAGEGKGVRPDALRAQAAADSALLERLRTHGTLDAPEATDSPPHPAPGGPSPWAVVDDWGFAHGFDIDWHGERAVDVAPAQQDALVRAIAECLENARRHSGRRRAEVTVTNEAGRLVAIVTDTGVGFDPAAVPSGRLGLAQSVEARIASVGGTARVFSSPGRGTTVLLEVPR
ncbi:MAG: ATP-binding protein [Subtercola sp.]|nr:ATP-binding protein [Subtercola sp.]